MSRLPCARLTRISFGLLLVLELVAPSTSAQESQAEGPAARATFQNPRFEGLFVDDPDEHGAIWARGSTYKMGFDIDGARYVPLFGSHAPRSFALELALRAVSCGGERIELPPSEPRQTGSARVEFERGALRERWDLAPESAEQSFVIERPLGAGDLRLELALRTDLTLLRASERELVFGHPGLGEVRYGEAVAIDARGERLPLALELRGEALEIRLSAEHVASARYPLVLDPILRTFAVDTTSADTTEPDAAYDASHDVWLTVCRERVSQGDGDILCRRYSGDGSTLLDTVYAEATTLDARDPAVASCEAFDRFLVVWVQAPAPISSNAPRVSSRERHADSSTQNALRIVHSSQSTLAIDSLDVGGSSGGSDRFQILWREHLDVSPTLPSFFALVVASTWPVGATSGSVRLLSSDLSCNATPRISKDSGPHQRWIATWTSPTSGRCAGEQIRFAILEPSGALAQGDTPLASALSGENLRPVAAGDGESFFLVWQRDDTVPRTHGDILGARIARPRTSWIQSGPIVLLSQAEPGVTLSADQTGPAIDFDGCRYVYAYSESTGGGNPRPFAATFLDTGSLLLFHEGHLPLSNAAAGVAHSSVKVATQGSGGGEPGLALSIWQQIGNGGRDIAASLLDVRATSGGVSRVATGCPNRVLATSIDSTGVPALGRAMRVALGNVQGTPLLLIGAPSLPLPLCTAATSTCELGVALPPYLVLPAAEVSLAVPCDALLLGSTVAFQGVDLGAGLGCPTALFGVPFRVTDTLQLTIQ